MKNSKSPINFIGALSGIAGAAAGTAGIGSLFGGRRGNTNFTGLGGLGEQYAGPGSNPMAGVDPTAQFNPEAVQNMQGIFGGVNARQSAVGGGGIFRNTSKYDNVD